MGHTLEHIDDGVYNMEYKALMEEDEETHNRKIEERKENAELGTTNSSVIDFNLDDPCDSGG